MDHNNMEYIIDCIEIKKLNEFFSENKTEMSCMDNPQIFLDQLRDYKFIEEEYYKKVKMMKAKDEMRQSLYELLDCIEKNHLARIKKFWICVFKNSIMSQYPTLKQLRDTLFNDYLKDENKSEERPGPSDRDNQQGQSSTQPTKKKKKLVKPTEASPLPSNIPVTCGAQKGTLSSTKMAKGEPCIRIGQNWYTPRDFLEQSGKGRSSHWKRDIRYKDSPIEKLFKEHHLKCPGYNKKKKGQLVCPELSKSKSKAKIVMLPSETGHDPEEVTDESPSINRFPVKCGAMGGTLIRSRFASGTCGKSIRTTNRWLSPEEFVKEGSAAGSDTLWDRDIQYRGEPLSDLIQGNVLRVHFEQCPCLLCTPDSQSLENQKNDDECCVCQRETKSKLVLCDRCPLSFHPECHLPRVQPSTLKSENPWICTFCTWKELDLPPMTPEMMRVCPVSNYLLQCHFLLLALYNEDKDHIFAKDPCTQVSGYSSHIVTPMWLDKITEQLLDNKYETVGQLLTDIRLIFSNCDQFNRDNKKYRDMGKKLKENHELEVEKVFRIQQQH